MEGICDMFQIENEEETYKLKEIQFSGEVRGEPKTLTLYEMDGKEESVLIGQALWHGSKVMARWMMKNHGLFQGKNVLEVGSGIGLSGLACGLCKVNSIVLTDYKE